MRAFKNSWLSLEFPAAWGITLTIFLLDALWRAHNWLAPPVFSQVLFKPLLIFICIKVLADFTISHLTTPRWISALSRRLFLGVEYTFLMLCAGFALASLSYLFCTLDFPLRDLQFDQIDKLLGFHWLPWYQWIKDNSFLSAFYHALGFEILFFIVYCSLLLLKERMSEIFWILLITLLITIPLSGILPAYGPFYLYKLLGNLKVLDPELYDTFVHVNLIRAHHAPDWMQGFKGIIVFPSFHTSCAVIYTYCSRGMGVVAYTAFWLNLLMLVSIPFFGGHYLIDVIAGILVALIAIFTYLLCRRTCSRILT